MLTDFDSPLHPLEHDGWKSNYVLSDESVQEFRNFHRTLSASLDHLDGEIARALAVPDTLLDKRTLYVSRIDKIKSAIAPHKKMPTEILTQIFNYTILGPIKITLGRVRSRMRRRTSGMPVSAQVCGRWREVALSTQILWNSVQIGYFIGELQEYSDDIFGIAQTVISRGSGLITLYLFGDPDLPPEKYKYTILPTLVHISAGAKHIKLTTSSPRILHEFLITPPPFFPALESIDFEFSSPSEMDVQKCRVFNNAPRLVRVHILHQQRVVLLSQPSFELPWSQLEDICILHSISLSTAHSILSRCPRLTSCSLNIESGQAPVPPPFPRDSLSLPYLNTLKLHDVSRSILPPKLVPVLELLVVPSLNILSISHPCDNMLYSCITRLIDRSRCLLRSLSVHTGWLSEVPAGALILFCETISPTLTSLDMYFTKIPVDMLARIASGVLFPRLENLKCKIDKSSAALKGLINLVRDRCLYTEAEGTSRILSMKVCYNPHIPPDDDPRVIGWADAFGRLRKLAEEVDKNGCTVVLTSH